nr:RHS repeat-associated core domain-containing protein [Azoarcus sp. L1K30]
MIREYAYDAHAHLASIRQRDGAGTRAIAYAYDASGRLIASQHGAQRHDYRFDPAGNRLDVTTPDGTLSAPADDDWARTVARNLRDPEFNLLGNSKDGRPTPNTAHWPDNRVTDLAGVSSRFDGAGNLVERSLADGTQLQLGYDGAHRLVALERIAPDGTRTQATYAYDALSRRIAKTVTTGHDTRTTRYGWDGERLVCEATETLTTTLLYEPAGFVPLLRIEQDRVEPEDDEDRENAREESALFAQMPTLLAAHGLVVPNPFKPEAPQARVSVFVTDHLGTPLRLVDHNGKTRWAAQSDDWAAVAEENGVRQPIRFQGQWVDEESGLYYNRYRYYDPRQGRYVTQDPIGLVGGMNKYAYVNGNPLRLTDPYGLQASGGGGGGSGPCFDFDKFANQIEENRSGTAADLATLAGAEAAGTMPKTPGELQGLGVPKSELNPCTSQMSRWSNRLGMRELRTFGRTAKGVALGAVATGALIFDGFYNWGVIGKAAWDATSLGGNCGCQK